MRTVFRGMSAFLVAGTAALLPVTARAWGDEGHKIVALIAYNHLTKSVKAKVDQMLRDDSDTLTKPDIASRATWADKYRDSDRNSTKKRYTLTREWHFVDIELDHPDLAAACFGHPPSMTPASQGPAKACIADRIDAFAAELHQLGPGTPEQSIAFKFVLHLVGDIHQPLHAADHNDEGGNTVFVLFGKHVVGQKLHSFWDREVVVQLGKDPTQVAAMLEKRLGPKCGGWMKGTPAEWAQESFEVAKSVAYQLGEPTVDKHIQPVYTLSSEYQSRAASAAAEQLEKAGCRLAMVLNRSLQ